MNVVGLVQKSVQEIAVFRGIKNVSTAIVAVNAADLVLDHVIVKREERNVNGLVVVTGIRKRKGNGQRKGHVIDRIKNVSIVTEIRTRRKRNLTLQILKLRRSLLMVSVDLNQNF